MNKNVKIFVVYEYESLTVSNFDSVKNRTISEETFLKLSNFISSVTTNLFDEETPILEIFYKKGIQYVYFKNYVGTFMLNSDTIFEILPKIYSIKNDVEYSRKVLLSMLKRCSKFNDKKSVGVVDTAKLPIFEIYIKLFVDSVNLLLKSGLKSSYNIIQENAEFLKGKIVFSKHVRENYAHQERFFVEHDDFNLNRPENRIIKSTLILLKSITQSAQNMRSIRRALLFFDLVDTSSNFNKDFSLCMYDRLVSEYNDVLFYAKIFLQGFGFSIYGSQFKTTSLLFSMFDLYEEYVYKNIEDLLSREGFLVKAQDASLHLFTNPEKFLLKPDIVVRKNGVTYIFDTKWKLLYNNEKKNCGISSADMYQMYAYHKRYKNVKKVVLLYPLSTLNRELIFISDDVRIEAKFIRLPIEDNYDDFKNTIINTINP